MPGSCRLFDSQQWRISFSFPDGTACYRMLYFLKLIEFSDYRTWHRHRRILCTFSYRQSDLELFKSNQGLLNIGREDAPSRVVLPIK